MALSVDDHSRVIYLSGSKLPAEFVFDPAEVNNILCKPITPSKLATALKPLDLSLPNLNCWEYMGCGREVGGRHVDDRGVCAAATENGGQGIHGGKNGGRCCWAISGTLCGNKVQGTFAKKIANCMSCDFYRLVNMEEGERFESITSTLKRIERNRH